MNFTALDLSKSDDKLLYNQVLSQIFLCRRDYEPKFTDFLYAAKANRILELLPEHKDTSFLTWGGFEGLERIRIGIFPFDNNTLSDFPIVPVQINFDKFSDKITHRDILGSILGLGIDRGKLGDILIFSQYAVVFLDSDISSFLVGNLKKIGKNKIAITSPDMDMFFIPIEKYKESNISIENPSLSNLISKSFNIGRNDSSALIKSKKVTLNWAVITKDTTNLLIGQTISVRGHGKIVINKITGKKFKLHIYK